MTAVLAVDFGATSIRVCRVELGDGPPALQVVHRAFHQPVRHADGSLRWDWTRLMAELDAGLVAATELGPVASIGVDTWAVDYGLLDARGELIDQPFCYRDDRTLGYRDIVERIGSRRLYETTGLQEQPFNTIFQLASHRRDELDRASHVLLLPELIVHHLTGELVAERSSAGCSGLVDIATGRWSPELCDVAGVDPSVFPDIASATTRVGTWNGIAVHLVGGHDTASAVVGMGACTGPGTAFVSSGTWLLVGREQPVPDTSERAQLANFTNETGALGGIRHLRNIAGFWLLERCNDTWGAASIEDLLASAKAVDDVVPSVDAADPRFLNPPDMVRELTTAAGLPSDARPEVVVRCILESMAVSTAAVLEHLGGVDDVRLIGGGARVEWLRRRLEEVAGVPVTTGPIEATALGNALVQGIAIGMYQDVSDARAALATVST